MYLCLTFFSRFTHIRFVSKVFVALALLSVFALKNPIAASAQVSIDPAASFYTDALSWDLKGLTSSLPQIRPYPMATIKRILLEVMENVRTEEYDLVLAEEYFQQYFGEQTLHVLLDVGGKGKILNTETPELIEEESSSEDGTSEIAYVESGEIHKDTEAKKQYYIAPAIQGDKIFLRDYLSVGLDIGLFATSVYSDSTMLPYGTFSAYDSLTDASSVGPLDMFLDANLGGAFGNDKLYVMGGLSRAGFGYFYGDEIALNSSSYHAANMIYNIDYEKISYAHLVESVGATDNIGEDLYSGKLLALQSLKYELVDNFYVGFYEAAVFGSRLEPGYVFPSLFMATQGLNGTNDNVWMGVFFESRARKGVKLVGDFFIDDLSANDLMKLKFNTKIRMAAQGGVIYAPSNSLMKLMSMQALLVAPYTYTHWELSDDEESIESATVNYQNYTNNGLCIGSSVPPNSFSFKFAFNFEPVPRLNINFLTNFIMHGNVNETLVQDGWDYEYELEEAAYYTMQNIGYYDTTGGINNHAKANSSAGWGERGYLPSAWNSSMFLDQKHVQTTMQTGISASYTLPLSHQKHRVIFNAGYTLEYVHNAGVSNQLFEASSDSIFSYKNGSYWYNDTAYDEFEDAYEAAISDGKQDEIYNVVNGQYEEWLKKLHDCVNHYFTLSVKFIY